MSGAPKAARHRARYTCTVLTAFLVSASFSGRSLLGSAAQSARTRFTHRLPGVAAPALVGVAAAFAAVSGPAAGPAAAQGSAHTKAATAAARQSGATAAQLLSVSAPTARHNRALPARYAVKPGDTLSAIAAHLYKDPDFWPVLYWANRGQIRYANEIAVGQVLVVPAKPAKAPAPPSALGPAAPPAQAGSTPQAGSTQGTNGQATSAQAAPTQSAGTSSGGDGSFQQCVIARESGGDSQVMNSSGHYGLYQFSSSAWSEYGGNPADFGNASVAEQNQVFDNAIAAGGQSAWSAYDGC